MLPPRGYERAKYLRDRRVEKETKLKNELARLQNEISSLREARLKREIAEIEVCKNRDRGRVERSKQAYQDAMAAFQGPSLPV